MKVNEYFDMLNEMPLNDLLDYLRDIGIEAVKIESKHEFTIIKEMNMVVSREKSINVTSSHDIEEAFELVDCYKGAA